MKFTCIINLAIYLIFIILIANILEMLNAISDDKDFEKAMVGQKKMEVEKEKPAN